MTKPAAPSCDDSSVIDFCLAMIRQRLPVVERTLRNAGQLRLREYLEQIAITTSGSYQPRDGLAEVIYQYASPLLGESVARLLRAELGASPVVLTANHHGVDYFAQSVQSSLLFSLRPLQPGMPARTVPVLACGNVSMNNLTFPRGILLYGCSDSEAVEAIPRRLPLFPDRLKRQMVSRVPGVDASLVLQAEKKGGKLVRDGKLGLASINTVNDILANEYRSPEVLTLGDYSDQAVVLNNRLWHKMVKPCQPPAPELVYLEFEKVAARLLEHDLQDRHSLMHAVVTDAQLQGHLLRELDGVRGCWQSSALLRRAANRSNTLPGDLPSGGTFLFWGIDAVGRRVPLLPVEPGKGAMSLEGVDDAGRQWGIPFEPQSILQGMLAGRLLPSLLSCFMVTAFARGVTCAGGYYQADYLARMQQGLLAALGKCGGFDHVVRFVTAVPTQSYLSGMQAVMQLTPTGGLIPAGPVEIIAAGGLDATDFERIGSISVRDAHIASLLETMTDLMPPLLQDVPRWRSRLAQECGVLLENKAVVKKM